MAGGAVKPGAAKPGAGAFVEDAYRYAAPAARSARAGSIAVPPPEGDPATLASSAASFEHMVRSVRRLESASSGGSDFMEQSVRSFAR